MCITDNQLIQIVYSVAAHSLCCWILHLVDYLLSHAAIMADKIPKQESEPAFAKRIVDPLKEDSLSREQVYFIKQVELAQWKKKTQQLRGRNVATGLAIGAIVMGICILAKHSHRKVNHVTTLQNSHGCEP